MAKTYLCRVKLCKISYYSLDYVGPHRVRPYYQVSTQHLIGNLLASGASTILLFFPPKNREMAILHLRIHAQIPIYIFHFQSEG
jgi:hypothetical protein